MNGNVSINLICLSFSSGKGGKNRRRGKNENEAEKRELIFKEDGQGDFLLGFFSYIQQC